MNTRCMGCNQPQYEERTQNGICYGLSRTWISYTHSHEDRLVPEGPKLMSKSLSRTRIVQSWSIGSRWCHTDEKGMRESLRMHERKHVWSCQRLSCIIIKEGNKVQVGVNAL